MAAPQYVPTEQADEPRTGLPLPPSGAWLSDRPGELGAAQPVGPQLGRPGPDQGYALRLARDFRDRLSLAPGEKVDDAVAGCVGVAMKRAALFGRAPVVHDLDVAFRVWGFLGEAPDDLVRHRVHLFEGASHHYTEQRAIADAVPDETLRLTHAEVARRFPSEWRALLALTA